MKRIAGLFVALSSLLSAQRQMSVTECETAFQRNNLHLLAAQYNINMADADILQARIWELPRADLQINAYNPEDHKILDAKNSKSFEISQLIYLGGKKKNEIAFAKSNKELTQLQFSQLLAELRTQLRSNYYNLYFEHLKLESTQKQLAYMNDLLKAYKEQTAKGNISLKDAVRLQSVVIQLSSDENTIQNEIMGLRQTLKVLTGTTEDFDTQVSEDEAKQILEVQPFDDLDDLKRKALENNADYLYFLKLTENSRLYEQWQKSFNTPDLTLGAAWDQNGGTFKNEINIKIGIPLPLWKTNQGNIEKARYSISQNQKNAEYQKLNLETMVEASYRTWKNHYNQLSQIKTSDMDHLDQVYKGMVTNFRHGNVSLLEFTDFMESYRQTALQICEMKKQIILSAEQLNNLVQTKIYY
ncbi:TolC family protein [Kaistella sp. DKR-2]|uniref:TolC family protein n=1 Tax=Kaistella soli TaxID=2849654 RepID=UPI001C2776DA|nr:TolC family protein [Kaistella soli]MBU8882576.1 TolC family protein [Kaistella soli]